MKLGVMSDTHNNVNNTQQALEVMRTHGVERIIHCGDISGPKIVEMFEGWRVDFLLGNVDYDPGALREAVSALADATIGHEFREEIDGVRIAATHGHDEPLLRDLIHAGNHAFVFHGHSHRRRDEMVAGTRVINPGAVGGMRPQTRSVCVIDLETREVEFVTLLA